MKNKTSKIILTFCLSNLVLASISFAQSTVGTQEIDCPPSSETIRDFYHSGYLGGAEINLPGSFSMSNYYPQDTNETTTRAVDNFPSERTIQTDTVKLYSELPEGCTNNGIILSVSAQPFYDTEPTSGKLLQSVGIDGDINASRDNYYPIFSISTDSAVNCTESGTCTTPYDDVNNANNAIKQGNLNAFLSPTLGNTTENLVDINSVLLRTNAGSNQVILYANYMGLDGVLNVGQINYHIALPGAVPFYDPDTYGTAINQYTTTITYTISEPVF